jgi:hypothetical protein
MPDPTDWFPVRNRSGEVIPSCGLVLVTGVDADTDDVAEVGQPDTDDDPRVAVLGRGVVLDDGYGEATFDNRVVVAYEEEDGTPASGEEWGVKAGDWKLRSGYKGFTIVGGASGGLVHAARKPAATASVTSWKNVVRAASTAAATLATGFEAGDTLDGVTLAEGDRILVKDQSSGGENGIYVVNASGAPTRATDADAGAELVGAVVWVSEGTTNADTIWACTTNASITIGTTATTWVKVYPQSSSSSVTSWKQAVRVATVSALTLASDFENGDTVDGVILATGDRILIKDQASGADNGIYTVNASGTPTRATDADSGDELVGAMVFVSEGTTNADTVWGCTTNASITIGVTATVWAQYYPHASATKAGIVSLSAQTMGDGDKSFQDGVNTNTGGGYSVEFHVQNQSGVSGTFPVFKAISRVSGGTTAQFMSVVTCGGASTEPAAESAHISVWPYTSRSANSSENTCLSVNGPIACAEAIFLTDDTSPTAYTKTAVDYNSGTAVTEHKTSIPSGLIVTTPAFRLHHDYNTFTYFELVGDGSSTTAFKINGTAGVSGTSGGGDTVTGGIITTLGGGVGTPDGTGIETSGGTLQLVNQGTVSDLTDSTTGTPGGTIADVGAAFSQTTLNDNFASLTAKVNAILDALQAAGMVSP